MEINDTLQLLTTEGVSITVIILLFRFAFSFFTKMTTNIEKLVLANNEVTKELKNMVENQNLILNEMKIIKTDITILQKKVS